jgi:hypothetical protein
MTWTRLADDFYDHPKIVALSDRAFRAYVIGLCYSSRHLTDGVVPGNLVPPRASAELVEGGLWEKVPKGFEIHDYLVFNPSKASVLEDRASKHAKKVAAGMAGAKARWKQTDSTEEAETSQKDSPVPEPLPVPRSALKSTTAAPRRRDELFETVAEVSGIDWRGLTKSARGSLNAAVKQIREAGATPKDVLIRAENWPYDVPITPPGLAKHWPALGAARSNGRRDPGADTLARAAELRREGR